MLEHVLICLTWIQHARNPSMDRFVSAPLPVAQAVLDGDVWRAALCWEGQGCPGDLGSTGWQFSGSVTIPESRFVMMIFPTRQVRVVRFYKSCPVLLVLLLLLLAVIFASFTLPWAVPDLNCELQIAVDIAGPQRGAPDWSEQCRTSTGSSRLQWTSPDLNGELQIGVSSAGPQRGAPDCSGQRRVAVGSAGPPAGAPERSGQRRASTRELPSGVGSAGPQLPEKNRRYVRKIVRNMPKRISEDMSERNVQK